MRALGDTSSSKEAIRILLRGHRRDGKKVIIDSKEVKYPNEDIHLNEHLSKMRSVIYLLLINDCGRKMT